jgi:hypothetical protein
LAKSRVQYGCRDNGRDLGSLLLMFNKEDRGRDDRKYTVSIPITTASELAKSRVQHGCNDKGKDFGWQLSLMVRALDS